ncbi:heme-binding domain-containing protein [Elizabethkingia ursingii]|uniref:heme-binding domain-containing protein n=1 Tax=Elizabethkingia ursingii TaxID=1756150 RepID=UPI002012E813|nr:heme-binding domain-containing protein [Elizabethkingia ursingii]MCL1668570.1 heme-binding domain-containing protein [Elizabethkingia ursingii]
MSKAIKKVLFAGVILLLLLQFFQPLRNIDKGKVPSSDFMQVYKAPINIQRILLNSCYDCHSNNTTYPFYAYVQPISYFLEKHINKGKQELNFNEWENYSNRKKENKLSSIKKQIENSKMPLPSYLMIHKNAKLSLEEKKAILNWLDSINSAE